MNWSYYFLSENKNITWEIIQENKDKHWDYKKFSSNPNITWQIIQENPNIPWNWIGLSRNPNIIWKNVQDHPPGITFAWEWDGLSRNPNITWNIVQDNPDKAWVWYALSQNPSMLITEDEIIKIIKEYVVWSRFKRLWRKCNSDPNHIFCQNRLKRECLEFNEIC